MRMKNKKAAIEMSIGTIIVIVLAVAFLVLGLIFVRSIMCSGIQIGEDVSAGVKNEVRNLFQANSYGVKCEGEGSQEIKLATGGRRNIICIVKTEEAARYKVKLKSLESLKGASTAATNKWVLLDNFEGNVVPGGDGKEIKVLVLDIPRDTPTTTLKLTFEETKDGVVGDTHISIIDIVPSGFFQSTIC